MPHTGHGAEHMRQSIPGTHHGNKDPEGLVTSKIPINRQAFVIKQDKTHRRAGKTLSPDDLNIMQEDALFLRGEPGGHQKGGHGRTHMTSHVGEGNSAYCLSAFNGEHAADSEYGWISAFRPAGFALGSFDYGNLDHEPANPMGSQVNGSITIFNNSREDIGIGENVLCLPPPALVKTKESTAVDIERYQASLQHRPGEKPTSLRGKMTSFNYKDVAALEEKALLWLLTHDVDIRRLRGPDAASLDMVEYTALCRAQKVFYDMAAAASATNAANKEAFMQSLGLLSGGNLDRDTIRNTLQNAFGMSVGANNGSVPFANDATMSDAQKKELREIGAMAHKADAEATMDVARLITQHTRGKSLSAGLAGRRFDMLVR